jgi:phenylalanyl-tRNA synthetase beta chain
MPIATFRLAYLQRLTQIPPEQLVEQAFDYGLEAHVTEDKLEVEVTAERPDLLAAEGFSRALNIYSGQMRTVPQHLPASGLQVQVSASVQSLRPYLAVVVVKNLTLDALALEALVQFQEKVTQTYGRQRQKIAMGFYDLDQVQGDLRYTTADRHHLRFVPLGSDRPLTAQEILNQPHQPYAHLLANLEQVPVLQDSTGQVLAMPPVINSEGVGHITPATRNLLIDVTGSVEKAVMELANILAHNFVDWGATVETVEITAPDRTWTTPSLTPQVGTLFCPLAQSACGYRHCQGRSQPLFNPNGFANRWPGPGVGSHLSHGYF